MTRRGVLNAGIGAALAVPAPEAAAADGCDLMTAEVAQDLLGLANAHRVNNGPPALVLDGVLCQAAHAKSAKMARTAIFRRTIRGVAHEESLANHGYPVGKAATGENIASGQATAAKVFAAWRRSSGHNANMLGDRSAAMGIGRVKTRTGVVSWTQTCGWRVLEPDSSC